MYPERGATHDAYTHGLGAMEYQPGHPAAKTIASLYSYVSHTYARGNAHA